MEKVSAVEIEVTSAAKEALLRLHGDSNLLSQVRIIVPIRREEARTGPRHACPVLRWLRDN